MVIGAVPDCHVPLLKHHSYRKFRDENLSLGFTSILSCVTYFNGGIIFCRDTPQVHAFFEKWHSLWKESRDKGNSQDMPSFNRANTELSEIITEMSGELNCQISSNGLPFLYQAKILHYFATSLDFLSSPFLLASTNILYSIKKTGTLSNEVLAMIGNPKSAFEPYSRIIADSDALDVLDSSVFSVLRRLSKGHKNLFKSLNAVVYRLTSLLKRRPGA
jgi:hypothetical protein